MKVLDLFSGIGGFSLGLERAGMETVAFCEIEPFCQKVLANRFPGVPIYDDIRNLSGSVLKGAGIESIDIVCGGFPCQDLSCAGSQRGITAERSGLWSEMCRIIGELRPRYVIVENVAALLSGESGAWFGTFLRDLAEIGYDAEWECLPAEAFGAPHPRHRVWIVAYPNEIGRIDGVFDNLKYEIPAYEEWNVSQNFQSGEGWKHWLTQVCKADNGIISKSDFHTMDDGLSEELDEIAALGNAVIPQIPAAIGWAIMQEQRTKG